MTENITRREAIGGGLLVSLSSIATYAIDKLTGEPMVPLKDMIELNGTWYDLFEKQRQEHVKDLRECDCP